MKGGGWAPQAYDELTVCINKIKVFRQEDKANDWAINKSFLQLVRAASNVTAEEPGKNRKRKSAAEQQVYNEVAELSDVGFSDDDDDEGE